VGLHRTARGRALGEELLEDPQRDPDNTVVLADLDLELLRLPLGAPAGVLGERIVGKRYAAL